GLGLRVGVVLLVVDVLGSGVLFLVDLLLFAGCELAAVCGTIRLHLLVDALLLLFGLRQLSAVGGAVGAGFAIDRRFFRLQIGSFTRGQLPALHALRNAVLLVFLALRNRGLLRRCRARRAGPLRSRTAGTAARPAGGWILCQRQCAQQQHCRRHNRPLRELVAHDRISFFCLRPESFGHPVIHKFGEEVVVVLLVERSAFALEKHWL